MEWGELGVGGLGFIIITIIVMMVMMSVMVVVVLRRMDIVLAERLGDLNRRWRCLSARWPLIDGSRAFKDGCSR
jgi:hypothetical protein